MPKYSKDNKFYLVPLTSRYSVVHQGHAFDTIFFFADEPSDNEDKEKKLNTIAEEVTKIDLEDNTEEKPKETNDKDLDHKDSDGNENELKIKDDLKNEDSESDDETGVLHTHVKVCAHKHILPGPHVAVPVLCIMTRICPCRWTTLRARCS